MFCAYPPIENMRILSLNRARRSRELIGIARSREKTCRVQPRLCKAKGSHIASTADSPNSIHRALQKDVIEIQPASPDHSRARMERLVALKTAIAQGRYQVSAADLAQKLINHMLARRPLKIHPPKN
jgi:anti-sigma28 factor (negative regulator of flagellin synthesis)